MSIKWESLSYCEVNEMKWEEILDDPDLSIVRDVYTGKERKLTDGAVRIIAKAFTFRERSLLTTRRLSS
jgi:hypothetical protein